MTADAMTRPPRADADPVMEPCTMVLFGASGDLAQRMVAPAVFRLSRRGLLPAGPRRGVVRSRRGADEDGACAASAWKKLFDPLLEQPPARAGGASFPLISTPTTRAMSTASRATTAWCPSSSHAGLNHQLDAPEDGYEDQSARALGKLRNRYFPQPLEQHGVEHYEAPGGTTWSQRAERPAVLPPRRSPSRPPSSRTAHPAMKRRVRSAPPPWPPPGGSCPRSVRSRWWDR